MRSLSSFALISILALAAPAFAGTITYSVVGTYSAGMSTNTLDGHPFTAPSAPWTLTFTVDQNPAPLSVGAFSFTVPFSGLTYTLNGSDTGLSSSVSSIAFYPLANFGMFDVNFTGVNNYFGFTGPQMFTGTLAAPTMLTGSFLDNNSGGSSTDGVFLNGTNLESLNGAVATGTLNAVPEPSTVVMLLGGALALAALRRRRAA